MGEAEPTRTTTFQPVELPSVYAKAIVAILTSVLGVLATALTDQEVTRPELANIGVFLLTALGVYLIPNLPAGVARWAKAIVATLGTGLQALVPYLTAGELTPANWLLVLVAALGALSVGIVPNLQTAGRYRAPGPAL